MTGDPRPLAAIERLRDLARRRTWQWLSDTSPRKNFGRCSRRRQLGCIRRRLGRSGMSDLVCRCRRYHGAGFRMVRLVQKLEDFRSTLVSVKEGGMITGEKKLREKLGELYGGVNGYCGRPTQSQVDSTAFFQKKMDEAASQFQSITGRHCSHSTPASRGRVWSPLRR